MSDILTAGICSYGHSINSGRDLARGRCRECITDAADEYLAAFCSKGYLRAISAPVPPWQDVDLIRFEARQLVDKWSA